MAQDDTPLDKRVAELEEINDRLFETVDQLAWYLEQTRRALDQMYFVLTGFKSARVPWEDLGPPPDQLIKQAQEPVRPPELFVPQGNRAERRRQVREHLRGHQ